MHGGAHPAEMFTQDARLSEKPGSSATLSGIPASAVMRTRREVRNRVTSNIRQTHVPEKGCRRGCRRHRARMFIFLMQIVFTRSELDALFAGDLLVDRVTDSN